MRRLIILILTLALLTMHVPIGAAQTPATPTAEAASPNFSLHAVGDYEGNYFYDVEVEPGETVTLEARVANWQPEGVDLRIYAANAYNAANGGFVSGPHGEELSGSAAWTDVADNEIILEGNEQRTISLQVTVPEGTDPGQYISSLVAETADTMAIPGDESNDHRIRYAISVSILVPGDLQPTFELGAPELRDQILNIPISNTGNYLVRPVGEIELHTGDGEVILSAPLELGSVYAGISTTISLGLPVQLPEDDYFVTLELTDPDSGLSQSLEDAPVTVAEPAEPETEALVTIESANVEPNDPDIAYANIDLTIQNNDEQMPVTVRLDVFLDGELVEEVPLATNQILLVGENVYNVRYLPADMWEPGTYTFSVTVLAVNPDSGQETLLIDEPLDAEIVVP